MKKIRIRSISLLIALMIFSMNAAIVNAEEIQPYSSHIGFLATSLDTSGTCLVGSVAGSFSGSGLHAIYYCQFQYLSSYGEYTTIGDVRSFRSYSPGVATFETYYCNPIPGVKYRFHTNMKVFDSNDILKDSDVINSNTVVW